MQPPPPSPASLFSADARNFRPSAIRRFAKLINDPSIISFAGGVPSPLTFPANAISDITRDVLASSASVALQYGPTAGLPRLREFCAGWTKLRGVDASGDRILITTGSQQGVDLVARTLLDPGDVVIVELPTYVGGASSFHARSAELAGVRQHDDGIDVEDLERLLARLHAENRRVKFLYTIPNFQNPSGRVMSAAARSRILDIARRHRFLIVEDDPYGELAFDGEPPAPIAAADDGSTVIYLSSFSKVLAPGLRCGWIFADSELLQRFELAKEAADLCGGMLDQSIVDEFCARDALPAQVAAVRAFYRMRRDTLLRALEQRLAHVASWTEARGGLFTLVTLANAAVDTASLVPRAIELGVAFVPGSPFFVDGSGQNTMRLTFAKEPDDRLREGVDRLAALFEEIGESKK